MKLSGNITTALALTAAAALAVTGCKMHSASFFSSKAPIPAMPAAATLYRPLPLDLSRGKPNEAGEVPILEYHQLVPDGVHPTGYEYSERSFRADMEKLYTLGYRPINLSDLVDGHIDCPAGKSPVVITFDDALRGQIDYDSAGKIDPNCAVGILRQMHSEHPDWALKGTFFVLPAKGGDTYFYQKAYSRPKLQWLASNGFEIGNHTVHHLAGIRRWPDQRVESEFAIAAKMIDQQVPGYNVDLLALPFGVYPKNQKLVQSGEYDGIKYSNICALLAGAAPAPSPVTKAWNPYRVQRIIPGAGLYEIGFWLKYLQAHQSKRYISDGDPNTVTVPVADASQVIPARVAKLGLHTRTY